MEKPEVKVIYPNKAKIKEIVMFVFAWVVLVSTIIFLLSSTGIEIWNGTNSNVEEPVPGSAFVAFMTGLYLFLVIGVILSIALIICWIVGLVISIKLVLRKNVIPRWMHISSIILMSCYIMLISACVVTTLML